MIQKRQGLKRPELRDELYMQLIKQTRGNPGPESRARAWELFHLTASTMPTNKARACRRLRAAAPALAAPPAR